MLLCQAKKISQSELARTIQVSRQTVGERFTQREQVPNGASLLDIAALLGTSISYLYGETDDPRSAPDWHTDRGHSSAADAAKSEAANLLQKALEKLK